MIFRSIFKKFGGTHQMLKRSFPLMVILSTFLFPGCLITGKVVDENGVGVAGVTVTLSGADSRVTFTNSKGKYTFGYISKSETWLSVGDYTVTVSEPGYSFKSDTEDVTISTQILEDFGEVPWPESGVDFVVDSIEETAVLFAPNHLIQVEIEMAESDWDTLRHQGRSTPHTMSGCRDEDFEYDYFQAVVTIDGQRYEKMAVRKKGFIGSLSVIRPSLKLHFAHYPEVAGRTHSGMKRMTLNNDRQDPSHTHQSMAYTLFRLAGLVAPRCNHARVRVNGTDLGIYSNVEPIKKPFLARHFVSDGGNLYESNGRADFAQGFKINYERKTNELDDYGQPASRDDLDAVTEALTVDDAQLYDALDQVMDMDNFLSYWAMEVITGHWDSYTGNRNNHYIYNDPTTQKFYFIPWGTDGAFSDTHLLLSSIPNSVYAYSTLANRLYAYPGTRDQYRQRLQQLLDTVWDTDTLLAEVDRIDKLTGANAQALQIQRDFISTRKQKIQAELDSTAPDWPYPAFNEPASCTEPTAISGTFRAVWGDNAYDFAPSPTSTLDLYLNDSKQSFVFILTAAGYDYNQDPTGIPAICYYASTSEGKNLVVLIQLPLEQMTQGEVPFHGVETYGTVVQVEGADNYSIVGFIGGGSIVFTSVGTDKGDIIEGSFSGFLGQNNFLLLP